LIKSSGQQSVIKKGRKSGRGSSGGKCVKLRNFRLTSNYINLVDFNDLAGFKPLTEQFKAERSEHKLENVTGVWVFLFRISSTFSSAKPQNSLSQLSDQKMSLFYCWNHGSVYNTCPWLFWRKNSSSNFTLANGICCNDIYCSVIGGNDYCSIDICTNKIFQKTKHLSHYICFKEFCSKTLN